MEIRRLGAGQRLAQRRLDRRPAGHGLDVPGKGQHVAPEPVGQEQRRRRRGIARLQGRLEGREPAFGVGLRRMARAILDQGHRQILLQRRRLHHARDAAGARIAINTGQGRRFSDRNDGDACRLSVFAVAVLELLRGLFPGKKINDLRP